MPVTLITEGLHIKANYVFIIPPQRDLHVLDGNSIFKPISKPRGWLDVLTTFLRFMARHWHGKLIAIIVSGFDGDRADALYEIRDVGGVTIAQRPDTAGEPDMPASAITSGCIDYILAPENIPKTIHKITLATSSGRFIQEP
jgi:two-component system chemotaxis response regulator CheB